MSLSRKDPSCSPQPPNPVEEALLVRNLSSRIVPSHGWDALSLPLLCHLCLVPMSEVLSIFWWHKVSASAAGGSSSGRDQRKKIKAFIDPPRFPPECSHRMSVQPSRCGLLVTPSSRCAASALFAPQLKGRKILPGQFSCSSAITAAQGIPFSSLAGERGTI